MSVLAVDLALMRDVLLPDLKLTPGRGVMARVVDPGSNPAQPGRGTLSIAGYLLSAQLPRGVRAGQELRLEVRDVDAHRVLLGIADRPSEPAATQAAPAVADQAPIPLPGGVTLRRVVDEDASGQQTPGGHGESGNHAVALRLHGGALGAVDLRLELDPATLRVAVALAPGDAVERGRAHGDELRDALSDGEHVVLVTVTARRDPLDLYA